jgi:hypothetical protein
MSSVQDIAIANYSLEDGARASSGHKLGQLVGDWFQDDFVRPILAEVAERLGLYLDHRLRSRSARGDKILWEDEYKNFVDYDFVLELGGSDEKLGVPVAFLECFWRRGSRHSKDKARDDSGKLMPMRYNYPTARFLGIVASGDFTKPAMQLIKSREIDLFYVPKAKVVESLAEVGNGMDYLDSAPETSKRGVADAFESAMTPPVRSEAASKLRNLMTETVIQGYVDRVRSSLSALPQEIRISGLRRSSPVLFETPSAAAEFLSAQEPSFSYDHATTEYLYEVTYSDGVEFSKAVASMPLLRDLNDQMKLLADHMGSLLEKGVRNNS